MNALNFHDDKAKCTLLEFTVLPPLWEQMESGGTYHTKLRNVLIYFYLFENMFPHFLFSHSKSSIIWCSTSMRLPLSCSPLLSISFPLYSFLEYSLYCFWKCLPLDFLILLLEILCVQSHFLFPSIIFVSFSLLSRPFLFPSTEKPSSTHLVFHSHWPALKLAKSSV